MNFSEIQSNSQVADEYEAISLNDVNTISEVKVSAAKVQGILRKEQFVKYAGCFTVGVIIGDLGNALISEISAKVYDFTVPTVMREISIFYAVSAVGVFSVVAIPIILCTYR